MTTTTETETFDQWWEEHPCPSWCNGHDPKHPEANSCDRNHMSDVASAPGTLLSGFENALHVQVWQNWEDADPHICIFDNDQMELSLTPGETWVFIERLTGTVRGVLA